MKGTSLDCSGGQLIALVQCAEGHPAPQKITEHHSSTGRIISQACLGLSFCEQRFTYLLPSAVSILDNLKNVRDLK